MDMCRQERENRLVKDDNRQETEKNRRIPKTRNTDVVREDIMDRDDPVWLRRESKQKRRRCI